METVFNKQVAYFILEMFDKQFNLTTYLYLLHNYTQVFIIEKQYADWFLPQAVVVLLFTLCFVSKRFTNDLMLI